MLSFFNNLLHYHLAHVIGSKAKENGVDVSIIDLNLDRIQDRMLDDVWRYCQENEADMFIDIYLWSGRDYIAHKTPKDIIFRETEMFKLNVNKMIA